MLTLSVCGLAYVSGGAAVAPGGALLLHPVAFAFIAGIWTLLMFFSLFLCPLELPEKFHEAYAAIAVIISLWVAIASAGLSLQDLQADGSGRRLNPAGINYLWLKGNWGICLFVALLVACLLSSFQMFIKISIREILAASKSGVLRRNVKACVGVAILAVVGLPILDYACGSHIISDALRESAFVRRVKESSLFASGGLNDSQPLPQLDAPALDDLMRRAAAGDGAAQFQLARMYRDGVNVPQDNEEAVRWFQRAQDAGNAQAKAQLAAITPTHSKSVSPTSEKVSWFRESPAGVPAPRSGSQKPVTSLKEKSLNEDSPGPTRWFRESDGLVSKFGANAIIQKIEAREAVELPGDLCEWKDNSVSLSRTMEVIDRFSSKRVPVLSNESIPVSSENPAVAVAFDGGFKFLNTSARNRSKYDYQVNGNAYIVANEAFVQLMAESASVYWGLVITPGPPFASTTSLGDLIVEKFHWNKELAFQPTRLKGIYCAVVTYEGKPTTPGFLDRDLIIKGHSQLTGSTLVSFTCGVHEAGTSKFYIRK